MIIAMVTQMSGSRYDDRQWPGPGVPFEVPDEEGEGLVRWHHAVQLSGPAAPAEAPPVTQELLADELPAEGYEEGWQPDGPPKPASPKADWVAYAISQGEDPETAAAMTKIDLMSKYGGRL